MEVNPTGLVKSEMPSVDPRSCDDEKHDDDTEDYEPEYYSDAQLPSDDELQAHLNSQVKSAQPTRLAQRTQLALAPALLVQLAQPLDSVMILRNRLPCYRRPLAFCDGPEEPEDIRKAQQGPTSLAFLLHDGNGVGQESLRNSNSDGDSVAQWQRSAMSDATLQGPCASPSAKRARM